MKIEDIIKKLNINYKGNYTEDGAYVIDLPNSEAFGNIFTLLENNNMIDTLEDNQVVTEEGSSLLYEIIGESYILNLLADWDTGNYQLIINNLD